MIWNTGGPVFHFHPKYLLSLYQSPEWLADWLEEELIHLLLGHQWQEVAFTNNRAFHLAADLEVRQYLTPSRGAVEFNGLLDRLYLPTPFTLAQAYDRIENQLRASGKNVELPGLQLMPFSRASHQWWSALSDHSSSADYDFWRSKLRASIPPVNVVPGTRFALLYNQVWNERAGTIPWPLLLRRFALTGKRDQSQSSLRRPSKRYGTFPGTRRRRQARLAIIIDTSGSISADLRAQFFRELQGLGRFVDQLDIVEADDQVRRTYPFSGQTPEISFGGGATNFDPALQWINSQVHLDGVVYLTDGDGPAPTTRCRFPLLWLITTKKEASSSDTHLPGLVVQMNA